MQGEMVDPQNVPSTLFEHPANCVAWYNGINKPGAIQ